MSLCVGCREGSGGEWLFGLHSTLTKRTSLCFPIIHLFIYSRNLTEDLYFAGHCTQALGIQNWANVTLDPAYSFKSGLWPWPVWFSWLESHPPYIERLQIQSQSGSLWEAISQCFPISLTIPLSPFFSLSKQWTNVLRRGFKKTSHFGSISYNSLHMEGGIWNNGFDTGGLMPETPPEPEHWQQLTFNCILLPSLPPLTLTQGSHNGECWVDRSLVLFVLNICLHFFKINIFNRASHFKSFSGACLF